MKIVKADLSWVEEWVRLRLALWPDCEEAESREEIRWNLESDRQACFIATDDEVKAIGFVEVNLRDYVDGCKTSPVGYIEGIYVKEDYRHSGIGRSLVIAAEAWAKAKGCQEMGSDTWIDDEDSQAFHRAMGYREIERHVVLLKWLSNCGGEQRSGGGRK
jgi:aminoglycoside 6'-N-acetyltransferase I